MTTYSELVLNFRKLESEFNKFVNESAGVKASILAKLRSGVTDPQVLDNWNIKTRREYVHILDNFILRTDELIDSNTPKFQGLEERYQVDLRKKRKMLIEHQHGVLHDSEEIFKHVSTVVVLYQLCEAGSNPQTNIGKYQI